MPKIIYGILGTLFAYLCFSIASILVKTFSKEFPTVEILFFQNFISLIAILPFLVSKDLNYLKTQHFGTHLIRDISGLGSYFLFFLTIKYMNIVDATVLTYTAPFYTAFICHFWIKEKISHNIWWAVVLGFIGICFILKPSLSIFMSAAMIGIIAGIVTALAIVSIGVLNNKKEPILRTLFYFFLVSALVALPFTITSWVTPNFKESLALLGIGAAIAIGQLVLTIAFTYGKASLLSPICYSIVIFTMILSSIIFKVVPDIYSIIGTALIILGGTLTFIIRGRPKNVKQVFVQHKVMPKWWAFWIFFEKKPKL